MKTILFVFAVILLSTTYLLPQPYLDQLQENIAGTDYWRLTKSVTQAEIERTLFSRLGACEWVRISDNHNGNTYDFSVRIATDPGWQRIIFADYNRTIDSYGDHAGEASFYNPNGICKGRVWFHRYNTWNDYTVRLYIADSGNNRIVELRMWMKVTGTNHGGNDYSVSMEYMREFSGGGAFGSLNYPMDVAYLETEGGSSYSDDFLWVIDTGNHRVVKIRLSDGEIVESFGEYGSDNNQFIYPTYLSICPNSKLYIVDSGNTRLAKVNLGQSPSWGGAKSYNGRYLYGIYADPFGGGVWAADGLNHKLVRYDGYLREVFAYGEYGLGQSPGILNAPVDIDGYSIHIVESNNGPIYKDLFFATEKWSSGSGQTHYRIQPKIIANSFTAKGIWQDPGGGGGVLLDNAAPGEPVTDEYDQSWLGTQLSFSVSDICYLRAWIYNNSLAQPQLIRTIWENNRLTMPGKVVINWDGKDDNGETHWQAVLRLNLRVESVYDPIYWVTYSFQFNPSSTDESQGGGLAKLSGQENLLETFEVFPNFPNPFNSTTHIRYQLPERGKVKIVIYNVLGQEVKRLVDEAQEAGVYTVTWDGANDHGVIVGSGIYFYIMLYNTNVGIEKKTVKLLLVK